MFSTIRFKITSIYVLLMAIILTTFSVILYQNFRRNLYEDLDDVLQAKADGVVESLETYWDVRSSKKDASFYSFLHNLAPEWVEERTNDPRLLGMIIRVFDSRARCVASSKNTPGQMAAPNMALFAQSEDMAFFDNEVIEVPEHHQLLLRSVTMPVYENGALQYIVQAASSLNDIEAVLKNLKVILGVSGPVFLILTAFLGFMTINLILSPIKTIMATARQISAENLSLRVPVPNTHDEIQKLAQTFNAMIEKLDTSFSLQRQFIEDMSHELRTPLTILKGELEIALKRERTPTEYADVLKSNLEEINRIYRMVEDLLLLARFENKEIAIEYELIELKPFINEIIRDMKLLAADKKIEFIADCPARLRIPADRSKLRRVLLNIVHNAIKHTARGSVTISAREGDERVTIVVRDTGAGIEREHLDHIFKRFYRGNQQAGGLGLGLHIARTIVEAHGGTIAIQSEVGNGTTVTVELPSETNRQPA